MTKEGIPKRRASMSKSMRPEQCRYEIRRGYRGRQNKADGMECKDAVRITSNEGQRLVYQQHSAKFTDLSPNRGTDPQVHSAQSSLVVTHPNTNRDRRALISVNVPLSIPWSPQRDARVESSMTAVGLCLKRYEGTRAVVVLCRYFKRGHNITMPGFIHVGWGRTLLEIKKKYDVLNLDVLTSAKFRHSTFMSVQRNKMTTR